MYSDYIAVLKAYVSMNFWGEGERGGGRETHIHCWGWGSQLLLGVGLTSTVGVGLTSTVQSGTYTGAGLTSTQNL